MSNKSQNEQPELANIRNIGIIAHIDAGKTTLTERFLYYSGKTHRIGDIDSGNTVMDYLDEERERGITIVAAAASFIWRSAQSNQNHLIHLIDTPGHIDFTVEVERSIRVSDGAVVIFSGVEGVEAQSEKVWRQSNHYHVPKIAFINKLDRLGASFPRVLEEMKHTFPSISIAPAQIPIGIESEFSSIIDLVTMKAISFEGEEGEQVVENDIPADYLEEARKRRDELLSAVADQSDEIAEFYLEEKPVPPDMLKREIRRLVIAHKLCPVFVGSAKKNIGAQKVLDAIIDYLPSPEDRRSYPAINPKTDDPIELDIEDENFAGLIFKIVASGSADLLYLRTYTGNLKLNDTLLNPRTGDKVRIKRLLRLYSKNVEAIDSVGPGDIVGIIAPSNITTGDTLCAVNRPVLLEKITFPEPVISMAIEPKSSKDKDRLGECLELLCREDPTLALKRHESTGQQILSGMGELHLEINCHRLENEFKLSIRNGAPQVALRETIRAACSITGIFDKTLGDQQLYAEVDFDLEPVPRLESGTEVDASDKRLKALPHAWVRSSEEALDNGLRTGGNWGYPLIYIRGKIKEIRGSQDRTTESAVAGAVLDGLYKAISLGTVLLEPIMSLDIIAPEDSIGEISGYLQSRRAVINGIEEVPGARRLSCEVPLAEMFGFSKALPKLSGGRGAFSMEPCGYQEISPEDLERMTNRA